MSPLPSLRRRLRALRFSAALCDLADSEPQVNEVMRKFLLGEYESRAEALEQLVVIQGHRLKVLEGELRDVARVYAGPSQHGDEER